MTVALLEPDAGAARVLDRDVRDRVRRERRQRRAFFFLLLAEEDRRAEAGGDGHQAEVEMRALHLRRRTTQRVTPKPRSSAGRMNAKPA